MNPFNRKIVSLILTGGLLLSGIEPAIAAELSHPSHSIDAGSCRTQAFNLEIFFSHRLERESSLHERRLFNETLRRALPVDSAAYPFWEGPIENGEDLGWVEMSAQLNAGVIFEVSAAKLTEIQNQMDLVSDAPTEPTVFDVPFKASENGTYYLYRIDSDERVLDLQAWPTHRTDCPFRRFNLVYKPDRGWEMPMLQRSQYVVLSALLKKALVDHGIEAAHAADLFESITIEVRPHNIVSETYILPGSTPDRKRAVLIFSDDLFRNGPELDRAWSYALQGHQFPDVPVELHRLYLAMLEEVGWLRLAIEDGVVDAVTVDHQKTVTRWTLSIALQTINAQAVRQAFILLDSFNPRGIAHLIATLITTHFIRGIARRDGGMDSRSPLDIVVDAIYEAVSHLPRHVQFKRMGGLRRLMPVATAPIDIRWDGSGKIPKRLKPILERLLSESQLGLSFYVGCAPKNEGGTILRLPDGRIQVLLPEAALASVQPNFAEPDGLAATVTTRLLEIYRRDSELGASWKLPEDIEAMFLGVEHANPSDLVTEPHIDPLMTAPVWVVQQIRALMTQVPPQRAITVLIENAHPGGLPQTIPALQAITDKLNMPRINWAWEFVQPELSPRAREFLQHNHRTLDQRDASTTTDKLLAWNGNEWYGFQVRVLRLYRRSGWKIEAQQERGSPYEAYEHFLRHSATSDRSIYALEELDLVKSGGLMEQTLLELKHHAEMRDLVYAKTLVDAFSATTSLKLIVRGRAHFSRLLSVIRKVPFYHLLQPPTMQSSSRAIRASQPTPISPRFWKEGVLTGLVSLLFAQTPHFGPMKDLIIELEDASIEKLFDRLVAASYGFTDVLRLSQYAIELILEDVAGFDPRTLRHLHAQT